MTPGDRFGYLVVLGASTRINRTQRYRCLCACGSETVQSAHDLRTRVVSCGCIGRLGRIAALNARNVRGAFEARLRADQEAAAKVARREAVSALYALGRG